MLVKFDGKTYRLPVRKLLDKQAFQKFKERNKSCEVLIYDLTGGHCVVPIESLEYEGEEINA